MIELNKIYLMDVIEGLCQIDSDVADIVIIDPPYNIGKNFGNNKDSMDLGEYLKWSQLYINESIRILKDSGTIFIYGFSEILAHISSMLLLEHKWIIWHYTNKSTPACDFWQRSHESIIVLWKDKEKRIFNKDDVREPYTDEGFKKRGGKSRKNTKGRFSTGDKETVYVVNEKGALPRDVIKIPALAGGAGNKERWFLCKTCDCVYLSNELKNHSEHVLIKHPTQKPLALSEKLLLYSKPDANGLIVVPFSGSGSECFAAKTLGMNFIGFDINEDYIKLANGILKI
jgi:site-specific DNA-methyltransferase (adenine-specific)